MQYTYDTIAKMIDHSLLHPTMTDQELQGGCEVALAHDVASVCIKPYAVKRAVQWLQGSDVLVGAVIGMAIDHNSPGLGVFIRGDIGHLRGITAVDVGNDQTKRFEIF